MCLYITVLCSYRPNRRGISQKQCDKTYLIVTSKHVLDFGVTSFKNRHRRHLLYITIFEQASYSGVCYNERSYNECHNKQFLSIISGCYDEHRRYNERCYNEQMLQRTVFINKIRMLRRTQMLQRTNATTNSFYQ